MSPATVQYQRQYKKLFLKHRGKTFNLHDLIGYQGKTIPEILSKIDEKAEVKGADPVYSKLYNRLRLLVKYQIYEFVKKEKVDWIKTNAARMQAIEAGVQKIFADAVKPSPPIVSGGTSPTEPNQAISTVKITEKEIFVVPTGQLLYLFSQVQNSSTPEEPAKIQTNPKWWEKIYTIPSRCSADRVDAVKMLMETRTQLWQEQKEEWITDPLFRRDLSCPACGKIGHQEPGKGMAKCECGWQWKPPIQSKLKSKLNYCQSTFSLWEESTLGKELYFDRGPGSSMVRLPARTRFTDIGRKVKNIRTYERAWSRANLLFSRGVFLTLTTDPALHKSLWHANRHLTRAWNRYLTLLVTRKKKAKKSGHTTEKEEHDEIDNGTGRLKYIAAYEFQENGLIHLHVCFFGIRYLASMDKIAEDWNGCGQGRIAHAYGIRRNGNTWEWNREKPNDAAGKSPVDYLKKYLEKALYVSEHFPMYWAINKRFCSMSRMFQTKECEGCRAVWGSGLRVCPDCGAPLKTISKGFRYLGTLEKNSGPTASMMDRNRGRSPFDALGWGGDPGPGVTV